jgi:aspartyl-tRNA(Asn)/glutamyl-tRNA(Gln) amidotransferase subunit A
MESESISAASAIELVKLFQKGEISPVKVVETMLDRISVLNPKINAFHHILTEVALNAAMESEKRWKAGRPSSSIDGVQRQLKMVY